VIKGETLQTFWSHLKKDTFHLYRTNITEGTNCYLWLKKKISWWKERWQCFYRVFYIRPV